MNPKSGARLRQNKGPKLVDLPTLLDKITEPGIIQTKSKSGPDSFGNHIYFYDDVDDETVGDTIRDLHEMSLSLRRLTLDYDLAEPPAIHLHIRSDGGGLMAGFALAEIIRLSKVPVHTHIEGGAASAATVISISGNYRTITKRSFILIHQVSSDFWGRHSELEDHKANMDRFMQSLYDLYSERTKLPEKKLKEILKRDLWFSAEQALEYGLVDEIL